MNAVGAEVELTGAILGGLTLVGIVQMLVSPDNARLSGIVCGWIALAVGQALMIRSTPYPGELVAMAVSTILFGALLGYCAGTVVAGVFLVADGVRRAVRRVW